MYHVYIYIYITCILYVHTSLLHVTMCMSIYPWVYHGWFGLLMLVTMPSCQQSSVPIVWLEPQVLFKRIIHSNCWLKILRASNYVQIYIATLFRTSQHQSCITQFTRIAQLIYILYNQYEQCELHSYIQIVYIHFFSSHITTIYVKLYIYQFGRLRIHDSLTKPFPRRIPKLLFHH